MRKAGKDPRRIVDVIQVAAAEIVLATHGVNNFSMPMHCYEYTNALGWFYDRFDHPRRLRLLYVAAEFVRSPRGPETKQRLRLADDPCARRCGGPDRQ